VAPGATKRCLPGLRRRASDRSLCGVVRPQHALGGVRPDFPAAYPSPLPAGSCPQAGPPISHGHSNLTDPSHSPPDSSGISDRSRLVALVLAGLLGPFGAHRFYVGRTKSGVLMALTLGGLGIWYLYDVIVVAAGGLRDAEGRLVASWDLEEPVRHLSTGPMPEEVLEELDRLRQEVAELSERVDFTERLLADPRRSDRTRSDPSQEPPAG
jgi:TM2 domain-containing protein